MHSVICCYGTGGQQACTMATHGSDPGQAACRAALSTQGKMEVLLLQTSLFPPPSAVLQEPEGRLLI